MHPAGPFYNSHQFVGKGRLHDRVTAAAALHDLARIASHFPKTLCNAYSEQFIESYIFRTEVSELRHAVLGPTIPQALWMALGSVMLVMLIAAANGANLFLVRMESRRREAAVRTALGASVQHMAVHYLSESWLLCGTAGVFGLLLAVAGLRGLLAIAPTSIPRLNHIALNNDLAYLVRMRAPAPPALMMRVNQIVAIMNPRVPVINARSMDQILKTSMSRTSFTI